MRKGSKMTEEQRKRLSDAHKGQISPNKGKKIPFRPRPSMKGRIPWNKRKKGVYSEEVKRKMSEAQKRRFSNPEEIKKLSEAHKGHVAWNRGIPMSDEVKRKQSEAHRGKPSPMKGKKTGRPFWNKGKPSPWARNLPQAFKKGQIPWNKGKSPSKEQIEKQKISLRKALENPELRKRLRESHKGQISPMKGKYQSEESKRKISETRKRLFSQGKLIHPMRGRHFIPNENQLKALREGSKLSHTPEVIAKVVAKRKIKGNYNPTEETRKKMSIARKGKPAYWNRGLPRSEETLRKQRESLMKTLSNPEIRKRISEASRARALKMFASGVPGVQNTKPERELKAELLNRGYKEGKDFIHQYKFMDIFMCDFAFPKQKIIVECDGDYWHVNPIKFAGKKLHPRQIKQINSDKAKNAYINKVDNGSWTLLRFWESDIKKNVSKCVDEIEEVLRKKV